MPPQKNVGLSWGYQQMPLTSNLHFLRVLETIQKFDSHHPHHDHAGDSYTPAVTCSRMKLLGVKKNYSMSLGDGLLQ